jgi:hypothetical protein
MRLFVSYPSGYLNEVEPVVIALRNSGHKVFFDRHDLPPAHEYDEQIRAAIHASTGFIFFFAPESFTSGRYQLSELDAARARWPRPHRNVLPVQLAPVDFDDLPTYIRSVTILKPTGNLAADISGAVAGLRRWNWRRVPAIAGPIALAGVSLFIATRPPSSALPAELTEENANSIVDELVHPADKIYLRQIIRVENTHPFLFVVYQTGQDFVFEVIKWRDGRWRIARKIRDPTIDFLLTDGKADVEEQSRSIIFSGCMPHFCDTNWGYFYYQIDLDRGWLLKASSESDRKILTPVGLPERQEDLYHFERRFYSTHSPGLPGEGRAEELIDLAILSFPRKRAVPPLWERPLEEETKKDHQIEATILGALGSPRDTEVEEVYREDLDGDGRLEWLVQTATGRKSFKRLFTIADSHAKQIFEDPGEVDSAWTRLALLPAPPASLLPAFVRQPPYVAIGGAAGSGGFPFWYVLQADKNGNFSRRPTPEPLEDMLNKAFRNVFDTVESAKWSAYFGLR